MTNWAAYDIALRQRGSLTVWFTEAAIAAWKAEPRATRGGQPRYSALAIITALTLRAVFRLALRQTEGLIASLLRLLGLLLPAGHLVNDYFASGKHANWPRFGFRGSEPPNSPQGWVAIVIEFADQNVAGCRQNQTSAGWFRGRGP